MSKRSPVLAIAQRELMDALRGRWVMLSGILFAVLACSLSLFGMRSVGASGMAGFNRTAISLLNLVLYLVPLLALLLSINSMSAEREDGPLEILLTQPISRAQIILGKFGGLAAALAAALLGGFGGAGLVIGLLGSDSAIWSYALLMLRSIGLGFVFVGLGLWISSAATTRLQALSRGLLLWFGLVILYDLAIVGATAFFGGAALKSALGVLVVANPVDLIRVSSIIHMGGDQSFGLTAQGLIALLRGPGGSLLQAGALLVWIMGPVYGAVRTFARRDF